ncbi:MAG: 1-acyl-sn-glycerol-3-phosphate acyltransferase [Oscillospiraceae bacterium]|nr:1-acyl-sn-glycerol-3-phosphate acyltransferase [Oscillospiraceae bacterium]
MDEYARHRRIWAVLQVLARPWLPRRFRLESDRIDVEGPILLISNHVTAWDPLLAAMSLPKKQIYYVASEHILRRGFTASLLRWMVAPIPLRKGGADLTAVKQSLKHLRAGHSVCIFAEGEQSWDGRTIPVVRGTGSLARASGATLVTFRFEGGYLTLPRWGRGLRRGKMRGRLVGVYPPEKLQTMTADEINDAIDRDIREDAMARQTAEPVQYRGKYPAEHLETLLYLCPNCRRVGTLHSRGDTLSCDCGLSVRMTDVGFFEPQTPFAHPAAWEDWQRAAIKELQPDETGLYFRDGGMTLLRVERDHSRRELGRGDLARYADRLECAGHTFELAEIREMAMTQRDTLLLTANDGYYQIRCDGTANLRKYLAL